MFLLRRPILALADADRVRSLMTSFSPTRAVVNRFVAGEGIADAIRIVRDLRAEGLVASVDHLGENTTSRESADQAVQTYLELIRTLDREGLAEGTEASMKLSALGQLLPNGRQESTERARAITEAAAAVGMAVNLDMEDSTTVDDTLATLHDLRIDHPDTAVAVQAMLRRTPQDLTRLVGPRSRVRLVKGAYHEKSVDAFTTAARIDLAYVRAMRHLMDGEGYPMIASHDPRMITLALELAGRAGREPGSFEFQMLYGIRTDEQRRLAAEGHRVRVYVPFGTDWYGYFARRIAEKPANLSFVVRAVAARSR